MMTPVAVGEARAKTLSQARVDEMLRLPVGPACLGWTRVFPDSLTVAQTQGSGWGRDSWTGAAWPLL